jgi:hypothetical protein
MLRLIDRECLGNAVRELGIVVIPARRELLHVDKVGRVAINLVGRHMHEGRFRAGLARRFEQVQRADSVRVEIVERDRRGPVMRRLRCGVHDQRRPDLPDEGEDSRPVAHVELMVNEARDQPRQARLVPACIPLRPEKRRALVVVQAVDGESLFMKKEADFRADQS